MFLSWQVDQAALDCSGLFPCYRTYALPNRTGEQKLQNLTQELTPATATFFMATSHLISRTLHVPLTRRLSTQRWASLADWSWDDLNTYTLISRLHLPILRAHWHTTGIPYFVNLQITGTPPDCFFHDGSDLATSDEDWIYMDGGEPDTWVRAGQRDR